MEKLDHIKVHIVGGGGTLFEGEADSINLPTTSGVLTLLPNHSPLVSTLGEGTIEVRTKEGNKEFPCSKGVLDISPDKTVILLQESEE